MTVLNQSEYNNGLILNDVKLKSMNAELFGNRLPNASTEPHVVSDGTEDLGSGSYRWKDGHFSGRLFSDNTLRATAYIEVNTSTGAILNIYNNYGFSSITIISTFELEYTFDPLNQPPNTDYYTYPGGNPEFLNKTISSFRIVYGRPATPFPNASPAFWFNSAASIGWEEA